MFSVPMIAFALASGSAYALTGMVSGVTGLSATAARTASKKISSDEDAWGQAVSAQNLENVGEGQEIAKKTGMSVAEQHLRNADMMAGDVAARAKFMQMMDWSKYINAQMNKLAHDQGLYEEYGDMNTARDVGQMQTQWQKGTMGGLKEIANMNNLRLEQLGHMSGMLSGMKTAGDYQSYLKAAGGDPRLAQAMMAVHTLDQIRHSTAEMQLMKALGLLPKNFEQLSDAEQLKTLANAALQLGGRVTDVTLTDEQAHKLGLPHGGLFSAAITYKGGIPQMVLKSGADMFLVGPEGVTKMDAPIAGTKALPPVLQQTTKGDVTTDYQGAQNILFGKNISGDNVNAHNVSEYNIQRGNVGMANITSRAVQDIFSYNKHNQARALNVLKAVAETDPYKASDALTDATLKFGNIDQKVSKGINSAVMGQLQASLESWVSDSIGVAGSKIDVKGILEGSLKQDISKALSATSHQFQRNLQTANDVIVATKGVDAAAKFDKQVIDAIKDGDVQKAIDMVNQYVPEKDRVDMPSVTKELLNEAKNLIKLQAAEQKPIPEKVYDQITGQDGGPA